jgi:sulfatase modifying factor 1
VNLSLYYHSTLIFLTFWLILNPVPGEGKDTFGMIYIAPDSTGPSGARQGFYIDRYEVTQDKYLKVMLKNPSYFKGSERPVEKVTWNQAVSFCEKIGKRLPTEREWARALRAGTTSPYYWGENSPDRYAWHKGNADKRTHIVGQKEPNAWGLYDMAGNVWEWTGSEHEVGGKVVRGGSWRNGEGSLKSSHRIYSLPIHKFHYVGFRCAMSHSARGRDSAP